MPGTISYAQDSAFAYALPAAAAGHFYSIVVIVAVFLHHGGDAVVIVVASIIVIIVVVTRAQNITICALGLSLHLGLQRSNNREHYKVFVRDEKHMSRIATPNLSE